MSTTAASKSLSLEVVQTKMVELCKKTSGGQRLES